MSSPERIKQPLLRSTREWAVVADRIKNGWSVNVNDIAWLLRNGERNFTGEEVPVPKIVQRYLADMIDGTGKERKRPTMHPIEREFQQVRAAYVFCKKIAAHGDGVKAALAAYAKANTTTLISAQRRYRDALKIIAAYERKVSEAETTTDGAKLITGPSILDYRK